MFLFATQWTVKFRFLPHSAEAGPSPCSPVRVRGVTEGGRGSKGRGGEGRARTERGMRGSFIRTRRLWVVLHCSLLQEKMFLLSAMSCNGRRVGEWQRDIDRNREREGAREGERGSGATRLVQEATFPE